jgi:hypothetical protein
MTLDDNTDDCCEKMSYHARTNVVMVLINRYTYDAESTIAATVLLGKGPLECQRLHGVPVLLLKSKISWNPTPDIVLHTV